MTRGALKPDVRAKPHDTPFAAPARVLLLQHHHIAQPQLRYHSLPSASRMPLMLSRRSLAADLAAVAYPVVLRDA